MWWQIWDYGFSCHQKVEFGWQTEWLCQICHQSRAGKAGSCLAVGDCGGKFEVAALVATRKWNSGGKRSGCAKFATQKGCVRLGTVIYCCIRPSRNATKGKERGQLLLFSLFLDFVFSFKARSFLKKGELTWYCHMASDSFLIFLQKSNLPSVVVLP